MAFSPCLASAGDRRPGQCAASNTTAAVGVTSAVKSAEFDIYAHDQRISPSDDETIRANVKCVVASARRLERGAVLRERFEARATGEAVHRWADWLRLHWNGLRYRRQECST